ncbi:protein BCL9 homolog [Bacillus rossius redtenbacheri]|uniref:protein BCL9 homolog n=1 Tax=Bacillus rossius redtenbacheri TaxID=93214 RepID=UPI002FDCE168
MIKDEKESQCEKTGTTTSTKPDLQISQSQPTETVIKEEPGAESLLNSLEDGEVSKASETGSATSSCIHSDIKLCVGSTNAVTSSMGTICTPSNTQAAAELGLVDSTTAEVAKSEDDKANDKSSVSIKHELNGNGASELTDQCEVPGSLNMSLSTTSGQPPSGIQPLPSNVINKQPGTMEAQYMQQQSQIFVFSTTLANKSADAVFQGQFPTIIAYHCAQPGTKKYLEKHPLKVNQFNRQNPAQWLNSLAQIKQKGSPSIMKGINSIGMSGSNEMGPNNNLINSIGMWNQGNNIMNSLGSTGNPMMQPCPNNVLPGCPVSSSMVPGGPGKSTGLESPCLMSGSPNTNHLLPSGMGHHSPNMASNSASMLPAGGPEVVGSPIVNPQPSLTGVKVPDENLTPQQRQHREEQLATLRKMQQMLFPEHQSPIQDGSGICQAQENMFVHGMGSVMNMAGLGANGGLMSQKNMVMAGMGGPGSVTPTSVAAQIEWQKLQTQFYEDRKKKTPSSNMVIGSSASCGPSLGSPASTGMTSQHVVSNVSGPRSTGCTGPRVQGPPPPYHQTQRSASVPTSMSSPNPSSPNNPTSNLSLPSPCATSGLNSPADPNRQPFNSSSGRLVSTGPSPTGLHSASLDSPGSNRPLNASNPGTPVSTHLSPSATRKEGHNGSEFSALTPTANTAVPSQHPPVDGMFCRTLQSLAQQKQQQQQQQQQQQVTPPGQPNQPPKEPNLMPVPSPQQIQYLNTFEGQELTIQKQPNTSLKETTTSIRSPSLPQTSVESTLPTNTESSSANRISGPGTPLTPTSLEAAPRFNSSGDLTRFPVPSPHTPSSTQSEGKSQQRFSGPSPQTQGPRTPGVEASSKPSTTEVTPQFLSSSPQTEGMGPPRIPNSGAGNGQTPTSPVLCSSTQNFMQQTSPAVPGMKVPAQFLEVSPTGSSAPVEVSPTGSGFSCVRSENLPLNPNSGSGIICNGKPAHFDPITSMAQMSQQLANSVANSPNGQSSGLMTGIGNASGVGGMIPFSSGMHQLQMNEMGNCPGLPDPQTGPSNFVGMQMQTAPHSYSPNSNMGVGIVPQCSGGVNTTPSSNQPNVHTNSPVSPKPGNMMMGLVSSHNPASYPGSSVPQRMLGRPPAPNPYSGANIQVKASAPNTIQYLPAKPQSGNSGPRGPPSLDFLQRFASPLPNLDTKVPSHNLQYFPNGGPPNTPSMASMNMSLNRPNCVVSGMNPQLGGMGPNCGPAGHMAMNGSMMGPNSPMVNMNISMSTNMGMGPGPGTGPSLAQMRGGLRPSGMMRMQPMGGSLFGIPTGPGQPVDQIFSPGPNNAPNSQMFVPGPKSSPLSLGGAPDASQPLPPSMGQSNSFKNSPFIGPTTADPNYAQQFHNFQQQLYATNTRSQVNNPSMGQNQSFFIPK